VTSRRTESLLQRHRPARQRGLIKARYEQRQRRTRWAHLTVRMLVLLLLWSTIVNLLTIAHRAIEP